MAGRLEMGLKLLFTSFAKIKSVAKVDFIRRNNLYPWPPLWECIKRSKAIKIEKLRCQGCTCCIFTSFSFSTPCPSSRQRTFPSSNIHKNRGAFFRHILFLFYRAALIAAITWSTHDSPCPLDVINFFIPYPDLNLRRRRVPLINLHNRIIYPLLDMIYNFIVCNLFDNLSASIFCREWRGHNVTQRHAVHRW